MVPQIPNTNYIISKYYLLDIFGGCARLAIVAPWVSIIFYFPLY